MPAPLRYLALGDSYTIGEGVNRLGTWPVQLAEMLRAAGLDLADPEVIAQTGWTTDELDAAISQAPPAGLFDLVTLLIGVNNQYRGRDAANYAGEFAALLQRAIGLAGGRAARVVVLSIPDWGVTPFAQHEPRGGHAIAAQIDAFNAAAAAECARCGVAFVDITALGRAQADDPAQLVRDGLHPSAAMYANWAALAFPVVRARLAAA